MPPPSPTAFIVDDDPGICSALSLLLSSYGWTSQSYRSAEAFLDALVPGSADCLIADLNLPRMSGVELLTELALRKADIPTVIITGQPDPDTIRKAQDAGALAVLSKPFKSAQLLPLLKQALASHHATG